MIDAALDAGVTFFDTADIYGNAGGSESLIGRSSRVVATGSCSRRSSASRWATAPTRRGSREYIRRAIEASLRRLPHRPRRLYQHHEEDPETPLEETFGALAELVAAGKVRAVGTSTTRPRRSSGPAAIAAGSACRTSPSRASTRGSSATPSASSAALRTARAGLHPVLPARERAAHRQGDARTAARDGHPAARAPDRRRASSTASGALAGVGRRHGVYAARGRDRRPRRRPAGRVGDRRRDQAGAGACERRRRRVGAESRTSSRSCSRSSPSRHELVTSGSGRPGVLPRSRPARRPSSRRRCRARGRPRAPSSGRAGDCGSTSRRRPCSGSRAPPGSSSRTRYRSTACRSRNRRRSSPPLPLTTLFWFRKACTPAASRQALHLLQREARPALTAVSVVVGELSCDPPPQAARHSGTAASRASGKIPSIASRRADQPLMPPATSSPIGVDRRCIAAFARSAGIAL